MAGKKNFTGGLSALLGDPLPTQEETSVEEKRPVGRPVTQTKEITKTSQIGTKEEETRATFIVNESLLEKIKAIAYWERIQIKDVIGEAFEEHVARYEKFNGPIKPIPTKK